MNGGEEEEQTIIFQDSNEPGVVVRINLDKEGGTRLSRLDREGNEISDSVVYGRRGREQES